MANLLSWAGKQAKRVENTVHNDVVAPIRRDIVQPATPVVNAGRGLVNTGYHIAALPVNTARTAVAEATHNLPAQISATNQTHQGFSALRQLAQGTTGMAYQLGQSVNPSGGDVYQRVHTPTGALQKFALGTQPIPSIQNQYKTTKANQGAGAANVEAGLTALMDALGAKGVAKGAKVPEVTKTAKAVNERAITNAKLTDTGLSTIKATYRRANAIASDSSQPVKIRNSAALHASDLAKQIREYDPTQKGFVKIPGGTNEQDQLVQNVASEYKNSQDFLHDTAKSAHSLDKSLGVVKNKIPQQHGQDAISRSSEHTPFYRDFYNKNKKAPTLNDYKQALTNEFSKGKPIIAQADEHEIFQILKDREHANASLTSGSGESLPSGNPPKTPRLANKANSQNASASKPNIADMTNPPDFLKPNVPKRSVESPATASKTQPQIAPRLQGQLSNTTTRKLQNLGAGGRQTREIRGLTSDVSKNQSRRPSSNYTTNPTKVNIGEVSPGDYGKARSNAQLASQPIEYAAGQVARIARNEKMTTSKLGRLVEGTDKPVNTAEQEAIKRYRQFADRTHATSQALGGKTPYRPNYFHHEWDLSKPEDISKFENFRVRKFGTELNPSQFEGLDTQPRVFDTVAQGEAAGFKLKNTNAANDILDYGTKSASALKRQALAKGFMEADAHNVDKPNTVDLGSGKTLALSEQGKHEFRAFEKAKSSQNTGVKVYRLGNRKLKQTLLSASEFHPINITKKVAPALAMEGHPVLAAKGAYGAFRAQIGTKYSDALQQKALEDGTVESAARIGTPIKFGTDYSAEGKLNLGHAGFGEKTIFEKSMPALHIRAVQSVVKDLKADGISLDSAQARSAGTRINEMMGFVNTEVRNLDKGHQRLLSDIALAPQFTRAKWATIKSALSEGGVGGGYARSAVVGDTVATTLGIIGLGYLAKQKSDSVKDMLIRAIVHPSVPTPIKDKNGNNIELGLPSTYTSEVLGLVANITRNKDGHIGITFKPSNLPGNATNYGRARLGVLPGSALKVATNTDYANKPLYDPNAPAGTKAQQAGTTLGTGLLPIGLQGLAQTNSVKPHLPQGVQQILNANSNGSNPILKSAGSSFGLTPRTDKTVGKGLQTTQYFDALKNAKAGLNANDLAAYNSIHPASKNPVTRDYQTKPTIYDAQQRATTYLKNPNVLAADNKLNQALKKNGQAVDPFFNLNAKQQEIALNYSALAPGDYRRSTFLKTYPFLNQLQTDRSSFFSSLPNLSSKPTLPSGLQYPKLSSAEQALTNKYYNANPSQRKALLDDPSIAAAVNKVKSYSTAISNARDIPNATQVPGYTPPVPKDPNSTRTGTSISTSYDAKSGTWTQVSSKTGRTTQISPDGTRTVIKKGTRSPSKRTKAYKAPKIPHYTSLSKIKTPKIKPFKTKGKVATYRPAKLKSFSKLTQPKIA